MTDTISLERPDIRAIEIRIRGTAPLICHKWSDKAKKEMLARSTKKADKGRPAKDPEQEYRDSLYVMPDGSYGFPAIAFKAAMVRAGKYVNLPMTFTRGAFHINGDLIKIIGTPHMREDMVRIPMGGADNRFRGEFTEWEVDLPIVYFATAISAEQLVNLLMIAGFSVGIGEWRPEKDGQYGTFTIVEEQK